MSLWVAVIITFWVVSYFAETVQHLNEISNMRSVVPGGWRFFEIYVPEARNI